MQCWEKFNLLFWSLDCKKLLIQDISDWKKDLSGKPPAEFTIELTIPNGGTPIILNIKTGIINVFTMQDFGFGDSQLFDGIYCIKVKSCDDTIMIHRALVCRLNCCYKQYISMNTEGSEDSKELIKNALEDIPLIVEVGRLQEATRLFEMVRKLLKNLNCNCK